MIGLKMRLHETDKWEQIAGGTSNSVVVVSRDISGPKLKSNSIDLNSINGVLDFSAVTGLHFENKAVKIKLRKTANSEYDFDAFRRKYLGEKIDFAFDDEPKYWGSGYYHIGNVLSISDNYSHDFRTIEIEIDSEPFKHPESGMIGMVIPAYKLSEINLLTGSETLGYGGESQYGANTIQNPQNTVNYANSGGSYADITYTGTSERSTFRPRLYVKLPITVAGSTEYIYQYQSINGHVYIEADYKDSNEPSEIDRIKIELDENHIFKIPIIDGYSLYEVDAVLEANAQSEAIFSDMWFAKNIRLSKTENGDSEFNPIFSGYNYLENATVRIYVNGAMTKWRPSDRWNPALVLRKGENKAFVVVSGAEANATAALFFERLVL